MKNIRVLPETISNKVAAGEVITRPSAVVKELIENSIDANSSQIIVNVKKSGVICIQVSDNGSGMNKKNALLSLERNATSKIRQVKDLFSVKTLGFRGEALPSIAATSQLTMITKKKKKELGVKIKTTGGKIQHISKCGTTNGTMVTVKQLFFNTPVRKKFLKSSYIEIGKISTIMANIALANPKTSFKLINNDKTIINWPKDKDNKSRIETILGNNTSKHLIKIKNKKDEISITGWTSKPQLTKNTNNGMYIYINNRFIKNKKLYKCVTEGYIGKIRKSKFPISIIFINIPYDQVDVNIHPTKNEVRFFKEELINNLLYTSIKEKLSPLIEFNFDTNTYNKYKILKQIEKLKINNKKEKNSTENNYLKHINKKNTKSNKQKTKNYSQTKIWIKNKFSDIVILGQYNASYILFEKENTLFLIDQHAAHERILYEKIKKDSKNKKSQNLLIPEIIETTPQEGEILKKIIIPLKEYGLEIEEFDNNTFSIKSIPPIVNNNKISILLTSFIKKITNLKIINNNHLLRECICSIACHGSIKAKQSLNNLEIKKLIKQLYKCHNRLRCPHGRPIWIKIKLSTIEKKFKRKF